jgi:fungal STAND N-terminal Goodbye domain
MAGQSGSARFQALFESALQAYERKTGITLVQHPLATDLQNCHSIDDITTLIQARAQAFGDIRERDRMMEAIKTTVSILTPLSDATSLADTVGLVCQKVLMACPTYLTFFQTSFPPVKAIHTGLGILLDARTIL